MPRLPIPGSDSDQWGSVLNEFLRVAHQADGKLEPTALPPANGSQAGAIKLAGDLGGTADAPLIPGLANKADTAASNTWHSVQHFETAAGTDTAFSVGVHGAPAESLDVLGDGSVHFKTSTGGAAVTVKIAGFGLQVLRGAIVGDGVADDSYPLQMILDAITDSPAATDVYVEAQPGCAIYLNGKVEIQSHYTTLRFGSPIVCGPNGMVAIYGDDSETPTTNKPRLAVNATSGGNTVRLNQPGDMAYFSVGDTIVVRGFRDGTGKATQKQYATITAINGLTRTLTVDTIWENDFLVQYPAGAYEANFGQPNYSNVTRLDCQKFTADVARGSRTVTVGSTSGLTVGQYVRVEDNKTDTDAYHNGPSNYLHHEMAIVRQISGNNITLSHALHHSYATADKARLTIVNVIKGSTIENAHLTWNATGTTYGLEMRNTVNCRISNCTVSGETGHSWKSQAIRVQDSYASVVEHCLVRDPEQFDSGKGYGITLYGATHCHVINNHMTSCRHSVLLFDGAAGNTVTGNISEDARVSDYDLHGSEEIDNTFAYNTAVGGDSASPDANFKAAFRVGNTTHTFGAHHTTFTGNRIINYIGTAFDIVPTSTNTLIEGNRVTGAVNGVTISKNGKQYGGISVYASLTSSDIVINENVFADISDWVVDINGDTARMITGVTIARNTSIRNAKNFQLQNFNKARVIGNVVVDPVIIGGSTNYGVACIGIHDGSNGHGLEVRSNVLSSCQRGVKLTSCPYATVIDNDLSFMVDTTAFEDAGGNDNAYIARNDHAGIAANTPNLYRTSGVSTNVTLLRWPEDNTGGGGLISPSSMSMSGWTFDPAVSYAGTGTAPSTGVIYFVRVFLEPNTTSITKLYLGIQTAGTGLTAGQNLLGIYDTSGNRIAVSPDQSAAWTGTGIVTATLASAATVSGTSIVVGILSVGTTTPVLRIGGKGSMGSAGLSSTGVRRSGSTGLTAQTSLPATIPVTVGATSSADCYWVGVS